MDTPDPNHRKNSYPISTGDIVRVILATLLVMIGGFTLVALLTVSGVLTGGEAPTVEDVESWAEGGITSLPTGLKITSMIVQAALIIPVLIFLRNRKLSPRIFLRAQPVPKSLLIFSVMVGFGVAVLGDEVDRLIAMVLPMTESLYEGVQSAMAIHSLTDFLTMGLTIALIAPVVEELIFRGFFQRYFEATKGVTAGVLAASALFAAYHFNIYWLIPILLMATVMGAMAWRAESVLPSIVVHATNNITGLIAGNVWGAEEPAWYGLGGHVSPWMLILAGLMLFLGLRWFFSTAETLGLGGHGPGGVSGSHLDTSV